MFGQKSSGANVYAQMGLETGVVAASPNQLIIMLYDG
ncbi:MAG: flagellar export chaperone FliS, partial [Methylophilus sp.]